MDDWHDAEQRIEKAQDLFAQRRWQEALAELRAAIAINPHNSAWHFNIALILDELHHFEEASDAYRKCLEIDEEDLEALYRLGMDLLRLRRFRQAIVAFARIESLDPSFEPCYCGRIIAYTELENHDKAEQMFYLARQYKDECPHCYANIARSLSQRGLFDKAIYCWQKTLDLDDSHPDVHLHMAAALRAMGQFEKARQHYLQELRIDPGNLQALLDLGQLLLEMGRIDEAGEKLRRAVEHAPQHPATHLALSRWLLHQDRLPDAQAALNQALELDQHYPGLHMALAELCARQNDSLHARRHLRAEIRLQNDDPRLLMDLANLLMDCNLPRPAADCLKRVVLIRPHNLSAWQNLAIACFMARRFAEGIDASHQALKLGPTSTLAMYNLALAYHQQADYPRATAWLKHAARINPADPAVQRLELRIRLLTACARLRSGLTRLAFWKH